MKLLWLPARQPRAVAVWLLSIADADHKGPTYHIIESRIGGLRGDKEAHDDRWTLVENIVDNSIQFKLAARRSGCRRRMY
jgi:hypothetical protein